jgi:hypothetical protein
MLVQIMKDGKMAKKIKKRKNRSSKHTYSKMAVSEIQVSRAKIGIDNQKMDSTKECNRHNCQEMAKSRCKYCRMVFCDTHSDPTMTATPKVIWSLERNDYEKYNKYTEIGKEKMVIHAYHILNGGLRIILLE